MGSTSAYDMAERLPRRDALVWHLTSNHFPPLPASLAETAELALDLFNGGDTEGEVSLPDGLQYRGSDTAPAYVVIEEWHLYPWITDQEEDE